MEPYDQPGKGGAVDSLELPIDEVVLGAALAEVDLCGKLDEEDWPIAEGVAAVRSSQRHTYPCTRHTRLCCLSTQSQAKQCTDKDGACEDVL